MNLEQLERGKELYWKIKERQKFINILENYNIDSIVGYKHNDDVEFILNGESLNNELREIIKKYIKEELLILENEFREL